MANSSLPFSEAELQAERWLPVVDFEGLYEVSDLGRVRSLNRPMIYIRHGISHTRQLRGRVLSPGGGQDGHMRVSLGRGNSRLVHALVLRAFRGPPPEGHESLHWDGVGDNNRLENLRWGTRAENVADAIRHGTAYSFTHGVGEDCPNAILTADQAADALRLKGTESAASIGRRLGVTRSAIQKIWSGKNWPHLSIARNRA